jgi:hypothetical protein
MCAPRAMPSAIQRRSPAKRHRQLRAAGQRKVYCHIDRQQWAVPATLGIYLAQNTRGAARVKSRAGPVAVSEPSVFPNLIVLRTRKHRRTTALAGDPVRAAVHALRAECRLSGNGSCFRSWLIAVVQCGSQKPECSPGRLLATQSRTAPEGPLASIRLVAGARFGNYLPPCPVGAGAAAGNSAILAA